MPLRRFLSPLLLLGFVTVSTHFFSLHAAPPTEASADPLEQGWRKATLYLFDESYLDFQKGDAPETRLGRATLLLLKQPKTNSNIDEATALLETLASTTPGPVGADKDTAATARYMLGRVAQIHRSASDLPAATAHYRRLIAEHPEHFLADQALIKLALIELYEPGLAREERLARVDRYGKQAETLARASSRRDLHLALATACAYLRLDDERCLTHYLAADRAGVERPILRANVTVAIGELASRLGRASLAREYFQRYLAEFKRDYRRTLVKDKLAALPAPDTAKELRR